MRAPRAPTSSGAPRGRGRRLSTRARASSPRATSTTCRASARTGAWCSGPAADAGRAGLGGVRDRALQAAGSVEGGELHARARPDHVAGPPTPADGDDPLAVDLEHGGAL